ncbi:MAG: universal stress protein [Gammaproteobacteria bacterium]|nr:universal stress protein [Gammaproteobacteria bacterium]
MFIKDLTVYVDNDVEAHGRIELAMELAERFTAHLTGVYVRRPIYSPRYIGTYIPADVVQQLERVADAAEREARDLFEATLAKSNIQTHWQSSSESPARVLRMAGRNSDLLILRPEPVGDPDAHRYYNPGEVVLGLGRPALIAPTASDCKAPARHAVIAWNGSREAARAAHDALPLLLVSERVSVVTFGEPANDGAPPPDITQYLARHELRAQWQRLPDAEAVTGEALLAFASQIGADLIVAGAYGRSRLLELVFGGFTQYLLRHASVPVLMSH